MGSSRRLTAPSLSKLNWLAPEWCKACPERSRMERHPPRVGCVGYLNARPLIRGWPGQVTLDNPAKLCAQLARGDLDVALVSSFEFLRNPIYRIVDGISISSHGPVYSVIVAHHGNISEIDEIELDPASETSVNLLRCLVAERGLSPRLVARSRSTGVGARVLTRGKDLRLGTAASTTRRARLLIGDQAIRFRQEHGKEFEYWDFGEEWSRSRGINLPFVYALWLVRPEVADPESIADRLRALRDENLAKIDKLIAEESEFDHEFCARYYREHLRFSFGEKERAGLREFQRLCEKHGLLPKREVEFNLV
jgi:chorismate dehydratase